MLGHGGMATVYLAHDVRHDRKVALKVLRPELAAILGAERFLHEIKTTANLQHPHILPLHDSGQVDSTVFYVMPFVEGESLRDRLTREKQLPVDEAVRIAREVASALDYAHRRGVIHRDIKPENILLHDGQALVADFGIALAANAAGGSRMTETGMSLGTPHYMSPEQAMGEREITARSDVYALGCVTYEMLIGEPPFTGPTAQSIVAKVMTAEPAALSGQRKSIPAHVEAAVLTALEKLPADRFASAAEFAAALASPTFTSSSATARSAVRSRPRAWTAVPLAGWLLWGLTLLTGLWIWSRTTSGAGEPVRRYALEPAGAEAIASVAAGSMAISRDGNRLAYVGGAAAGATQIWIRDRDQLHARPLSGTAGAHDLSWSPDGRQLAFVVDRVLKVIPLDGASPLIVADSLISGGGTAWGPDGLLYSASSFNRTSGIVRVPVTGGAPTAVTTPDSAAHAFAHLNPALLPNNRGLLFSIWYGPTRPTDTDIAVAVLKTGRFRILQRGVRARYLASGHLLIARADGSLVTVPFDQDRMVTIGPAVPVITGLAVRDGYIVDYDVSDAGTLVYYAGEPRSIRETVQPVWVTRDGRSSTIDSGWTLVRPFNGGLSLSPDGRRLAVAIAGEPTSDIWIKQLDHGPLSRLTFEEFLKYRPVWTPDGREVTYLVDPGNNNASIYRKRADGGGVPERVLASNRSLAEALWSRDAQWLVVRTTVPSRDILGFRPGTDSVPVPLVASPKFEERAATLSPDGRFLAYQSDESGRDEVYVRPFPKADDGRWQVSTAGGEEPLWSHGGREIFFRSSSGQMMAVPVASTPSFSLGTPRALFPTTGYAKTPGNRAYDVTPDDQRFVMLHLVADSAGRTPVQLVFVDNWFEELRAKTKRP